MLSGPLFDGASKQDAIEPILAKDGQGAASIADVDAWVSGRTGVHYGMEEQLRRIRTPQCQKPWQVESRLSLIVS